MDIRVSGHQMDTGAALQDHVSDRLNTIVEKYFGGAVFSQGTFGKAPARMVSCRILTPVMRGLLLKANATAPDAHVALDQAAEKIDKQLRRYKRRIQDRHEQSAHALREEEASYRIFAAPEVEAEVEEEDDAGAPPIIAETTADIPEASVADAVMMLDLRHTNALLFKNAGTGRHNMVYRRNDGSIGWVEPR